MHHLDLSKIFLFEAQRETHPNLLFPWTVITPSSVCALYVSRWNPRRDGKKRHGSRTGGWIDVDEFYLRTLIKSLVV